MTWWLLSRDSVGFVVITISFVKGFTRASGKRCGNSWFYALFVSWWYPKNFLLFTFRALPNVSFGMRAMRGKTRKILVSRQFPVCLSPCSCRQGEFKKPQPIPSHSRAGDRYIKYARKCASAGAKRPDALTKQGHAVTKQPDAEAKHPQAERKLLISRRLSLSWDVL